MLAAILPGIREIRAPLAAGYAWLGFAYLAAGSPSDIGANLGPLSALGDQVASLGPLAVGGVVSFVAYLIGSVSQDVFSARLVRVVRRVLWRRGPPTISGLEQRQSAVGARAADALRRLQNGGGGFDEALAEVVQAARAARRGLERAPLAGAPEEERPESRRAMVQTEGQLRIALIPPAVALSAYLTLTASAFWAIGLLVALALLWQAILRLSEEDRLALAHEHATQSAALAAGIDEALLALNRSDPTDGLRKLADLRPRPPMVL